MKPLGTIATHPGTGTEIVLEICDALHAELAIIDDLKTARKARFDGLILLGGADIDPRLYGQLTTWSWNANHERDAIEWVLARRALADGKPIMGICRGHQMLTIAAGGTLYQDIYRDAATTHHPSSHVITADRPLRNHIPTARVNSYHHQAAKREPFGFKTVAKAPDGIVEAIWRPGYLGVQWHPELLFPTEYRWIGLFEWFIKDHLQ